MGLAALSGILNQAEAHLGSSGVHLPHKSDLPMMAYQIKAQQALLNETDFNFEAADSAQQDPY